MMVGGSGLPPSGDGDGDGDGVGVGHGGGDWSSGLIL